MSCSYCNAVLVEFDEIYGTCCGHIFHQKCLSYWNFNLLDENICPTCSATCTPYDTERLYMYIPNKTPEEASINDLTSRINKTKLQVQRTINRTKDVDKLKELKTLMEQTKQTEKTIDKIKTQNLRRVRGGSISDVENQASPSVFAKIILKRDVYIQELQDNDEIVKINYNLHVQHKLMASNMTTDTEQQKRRG